MTGRRLSIFVTRLEEEKWYQDWQMTQVQTVDRYLETWRKNLDLVPVDRSIDLSIRDSDDQLLRGVKLQCLAGKKITERILEKQQNITNTAVTTGPPTVKTVQKERRQDLLTKIIKRSESCEPPLIAQEASRFAAEVVVQASPETPPRISTTIGWDETPFPWEILAPAATSPVEGDYAEGRPATSFFSVEQTEYKVSASPVQSRTVSPLLQEPSTRSGNTDDKKKKQNQFRKRSRNSGPTSLSGVTPKNKKKKCSGDPSKKDPSSVRKKGTDTQQSGNQNQSDPISLNGATPKKAKKRKCPRHPSEKEPLLSARKRDLDIPSATRQSGSHSQSDPTSLNGAGPKIKKRKWPRDPSKKDPSSVRKKETDIPSATRKSGNQNQSVPSSLNGATPKTKKRKCPGDLSKKDPSSFWKRECIPSAIRQSNQNQQYSTGITVPSTSSSINIMVQGVEKHVPLGDPVRRIQPVKSGMTPKSGLWKILMENRQKNMANRNNEGPQNQHSVPYPYDLT